jgi:DNA-binding transcriptional LysR family regulator
MIDKFALFAAVVEKSGLAAGGRELGLSAAAATERLAALEAHFGAKLLNRTTRAISLTDEGRIVLASVRRVLAEVGELEHRVRAGIDQLAGQIRLSTPFDIGRQRIAPLLDRFQAMHPRVEFDLRFTDGYVDIAGSNTDFAVRYGNLRDSSLRLRRIGVNHRLPCASPAYLEKYGRPNNPDELSRHNCILMRFGDTVDREWPFREGTREYTVTVCGNRIANNGALVRDWALDGHGIALKSIWDIGHDLADGKLVALLKDHLPSPSALQIVHLANRTMPRRISALIEFLLEELVRDAPQFPVPR